MGATWFVNVDKNETRVGLLKSTFGSLRASVLGRRVLTSIILKASPAFFFRKPQ